MKTRVEEDTLGKKRLPLDAYFGIFTSRVLENFNIWNNQVPFEFLRNYIRVKKVYAKVNSISDKLRTKESSLIKKTCDYLLKLDRQVFMNLFPIGQIQSGGGTSTNMMVNEVISNFANEVVKRKKGSYEPIHPNDHVNMSQSSNDTFPGVIKITTTIQIQKLLSELSLLEKSFIKKAKEAGKLKKVGRTHLQDALVIGFADEFSAYAETIRKNIVSIREVRRFAIELPLGATALGSLQNITAKIRVLLIKEASKEFGVQFKKPKNYFESTSSSSDMQRVSGTLNNLSSDLIKISNDLRLLSSGPRAGLSEIVLPEVQAGSSIMPGKVNPSILEALNMICFRVKGLSTTIDLATMHSQLQLQAFMPVIGFSLFESFELLTSGIFMFRKSCLDGIKVNEKQTSMLLNNSFVYATEYSEKLGYSKVAELVKKAYKEDVELKELLDKELEK